VLRFNNGQLPKHGAIWLTYYPNIMVEWYPNVLCISTLHPWARARRATSSSSTTPRKSRCSSASSSRPSAPPMETCVEDDEIAERMDAGRLALMKRGDQRDRPLPVPMEDGMQHFHEWYRRVMDYSRLTGVR
jgi:phenylpropionate dioxygenase-like ring-hydroxylating dioxygenase large terminal subunit